MGKACHEIGKTWDCTQSAKKQLVKVSPGRDVIEQFLQLQGDVIECTRNDQHYVMEVQCWKQHLVHHMMVAQNNASGSQ